MRRSFSLDPLAAGHQRHLDRRVVDLLRRPDDAGWRWAALADRLAAAGNVGSKMSALAAFVSRAPLPNELPAASP